ncbi:MAG: hypothetical protein ACJ768_22355 [Gaiellaceae bacterium]
MRSIFAAVGVVLVLAPVASAATSPSPAACAVAWNRWASPHLHALVARSNARAAFVDARVTVGTDTFSKTGGTTSTSARGCAIQVVLPDKTLLEVWGPWQNGTIRTWHGPVRGHRPFPVPHNARVHSDGTIGFTG